MVTDSFSRWVEVPEAVPVKFGDLAFLIADALHSTEFAAAAAAINLENELAEMVSRGTLKVRDSLTMGEHTFPIGDSLRRAVLFPYELRPLLESRGIGLRLKPHGSGPDRWTMEYAAKAIGDQQGWHQGARDSLVARMVEGAESGALAVLDPHTDLPYRPGKVRPYYDLLNASDIDAWLERSGVSYRLRPSPTRHLPSSLIETEALPSFRADTTPAGDWKKDATLRGWAIVKEATSSSRTPSQLDIANQIAREWNEAKRFGPNGSALSGEYIKRHALVPAAVSCKRARLKSLSSTKSSEGKQGK
jgi:hypothetical protein